MYSIADIARVLEALPISANPAFRVIADGKLRYRDRTGVPDYVDVLSAKLVCSALKTHQPTLVVLPDRQARRASLLFAAALVIDAVTATRSRKRNVLYVADHVGIRDHVGSTRIGTLALDAVFQQQYGRGSSSALKSARANSDGHSAASGGALADVACVCAPADPEALVAELRPAWIAVDCGDALNIEWLPSLLSVARRAAIPLVGWSTRPFSGIVNMWTSAGATILRWPLIGTTASPRSLKSAADMNDATIRSTVTPRVLAGEHVAPLAQQMATVVNSLSYASSIAHSRLESDAALVGWRYLRALEGLCVPFDLYELESRSQWGVRPVAQTAATFSRFIEAVKPRSPALHQVLESAASVLDSLSQELRSIEPPLWLGLANLCVEGDRRTLIFSSRARRDLFAFGLLARFNITNEDLHEVGITLTTIGELGSRFGKSTKVGNREGRFTIVGPLSRSLEQQFDTILQAATDPEVLIWPHHELSLARKIRTIGEAAAGGAQHCEWLVEESALPSPLKMTPVPRAHVQLAKAIHSPAGAVSQPLRDPGSGPALWGPPEAAEAMEALFGAVPGADDDDTPEHHDQTESRLEPRLDPSDGESTWVETGVMVRVAGGRQILFASDDAINVIVYNPNGPQLQQRFVRSLRAGDEILYIQGQNRQSLYELIVSRVHRHPTIAQYLSLVERWQDDFVKGVAAAKRARRVTPESLLEELQQRGSALVAPETIRLWLRRRVLAPEDVKDLTRLADILSLDFVRTYATQIHRAARRLKGLHIALSAKLNRWLTSQDAGTVVAGSGDDLVDADLGLTFDDFRHSLLRLRVVETSEVAGPFWRPRLGQIQADGDSR